MLRSPAPAAVTIGVLRQHLLPGVPRRQMPHSPAAPGAHLGHGAKDSRGQPRSQAVSHKLALTCVQAGDQPASVGHAVYGMQEVSGLGFVGIL
jgi:hypothetical protein